jgi:hypothetical protein
LLDRSIALIVIIAAAAAAASSLRDDETHTSRRRRRSLLLARRRLSSTPLLDEDSLMTADDSSSLSSAGCLLLLVKRPSGQTNRSMDRSMDPSIGMRSKHHLCVSDVGSRTPTPTKQTRRKLTSEFGRRPHHATAEATP